MQRETVTEAAKSNHVEHGLRTAPAFGEGNVPNPQRIGHVLPYAHVRKKRVGLKDNAALA